MPKCLTASLACHGGYPTTHHAPHKGLHPSGTMFIEGTVT